MKRCFNLNLNNIFRLEYNHSGKKAKSTWRKRCSSSWTSYLPRDRTNDHTSWHYRSKRISFASDMGLSSCQRKFLQNTCKGSMALAHKSGLMTSDNFVKVLQFFVNFARCSNDRKVLLILDNYQSHISIESITFAKENALSSLRYQSTLLTNCSRLN